MLDGEAGATGAGIVVNHFDILDGRIRVAKNFDRPAVGKEKLVLGNRHVRLQLSGQFPRDKMIRSGDAKSPQHRVGGDPVAKIDDMVDNRRIPGLRRNR